REWAHDFTGTITGDTFTGTYQDRPGYVRHFHGTISGTIRSTCHIDLVLTVVENGDVVHGPITRACPPGTSTTPTTSPAPLTFTWKVPDRFGLDADGDGLIDCRDTTAAVQSGVWAVLVHINGCDPAASYVFSTAGRGLPSEVEADEGTCWYRVSGFPRLGRYTLRVVAPAERRSGTRRILLNDWLVVGIGDSAGSGEGSPDIPGTT